MSFTRYTQINSGPGGSTVPAVAIAGAADEAALGVADAVAGSGIRFFLVGRKSDIDGTAAKFGFMLNDCDIIDLPDDATEADTCRKAVELCRSGAAGVLMKGHVGTASFTRAILDRESGLTGPGALLSHVGLFEDPRYPVDTDKGSEPEDRAELKPFFLSDAAINIAPGVEEKKKILANTVAVVRALGVKSPAIALLAPVEKVSVKIPSTTDATALAEWINGGGLGHASAGGPFALDVAACSRSAEVKGVGGTVAGNADIYLAPGLDAGNILYKSLTVFSGARAAGILAGADVPVVLTSRADAMEVKLASLGFALNVAAGGEQNGPVPN